VVDAVLDTRLRIVEAARRRLLIDGFVGLSTRKVADEAEVPLSQLHYHFGSKGGLVLALFEEENKRRLDRQTRMYAEDAPCGCATSGPATSWRTTSTRATCACSRR
jgi:AcrR family transcriptional regulator